MPSSTRFTWTVRELCVTLACVIILGSVAWMAILRSIEIARLQRCQVNLQALGLALRAYHTAQRVFPPAAVVRGNWQGNIPLTIRTSRGEPYLIPDVRANWAVLMLPFLDEAHAFNGPDVDASAFDPENRSARLTRLATMTCPSDVFNQQDNTYRIQLASGTEASFARGNYAFNGGVNGLLVQPGRPWNPAPNGRIRERFEDPETGAISDRVWGSGIGGINRSFALAEIGAGQANLVALDEVRTGITADDSRGVWALGLVGASITWGHGLIGDAVGPNSNQPRSDDTIGCNQVHQAYGADQLIRIGMQCCSYIPRQKQATARSLHGGVNVLMLDGATRFIADGVDRNVWHSLHSSEAQSMAKQEVRERGATTAVAENRNATKFVAPSAYSDLRNSIGMQLRFIPAGSFIMGRPDLGEERSDPATGVPEEAPPHQVQLTRGFYLGVHEVTQSQYTRVMGSNPSWHPTRGTGNSTDKPRESHQYPVERVTWFDAKKFCERLGRLPRERLHRRRYRLPTEAEWEYACRAGSSDPFDFRQAVRTARETGFNALIESGPGIQIRAVGSAKPNAFGLHDMRSNVFEWCSDWFAWDYYRNSPRRDPPGPDRGVLKVVRYADWRFSGMDCKFTRFDTEPSRASRFIGFRVVCEIPGQQP